MSKKLSSMPSILWRHWHPAMITLASVIVAAVAYLKITPQLYEAKARLTLDDRQVSVSDIGRDLARLPEGGAGSPNPLATEAELIKSQPLLERAIARMSATGVKDVPSIGQLSRELRVKIVPATNILELSYRGRSPELTAGLLNAVTASAVEENLETIRTGARAIKDFLEAEVPKQRTQLRQIEEAENRYRRDNQLISVDEQTKQLVQSLGATLNQERDLSTQLQEVMVRNASLQQVVKVSSPQAAFIAVRVGQDEELKTLRTKVDDLEARVIEMRSRLGDQHPDLLSLTEQRNEVRKLYATKLTRIVPGAASSAIAGDALSQDLISRLITSKIEQATIGQKLAAVRQIRLTLQAQLADLPNREQPLVTLIRKREEAETTLKLLQTKLQEATIAEAQLVSNIKVIANAELPTKPEWPKKSSVLVTATALGLVLVIGVVLLLELLDKSLHDPSDIEQLLGQPALGRLPSLPQNSSLLSGAITQKMHHLIEPYRKLLRTLESRHGSQLRRVVISSALAHEGKSTVAAHLAMMAALQSRRTLLVDANLWQPEQHHLFHLQTLPTLAVPFESKQTLEQVIQPTYVANLSLLTCSNVSTSLLAMESEQMTALLATAEKQFDFVIFDTPSIISCGDAFALSRHSDGLVLVVCPGVTTQDGLSQAWADIDKDGVPFFGFVLNRVEIPIDRDSLSPPRFKPFAPVSNRFSLPKLPWRWLAIHARTS